MCIYTEMHTHKYASYARAHTHTHIHTHTYIHTYIQVIAEQLSYRSSDTTRESLCSPQQQVCMYVCNNDEGIIVLSSTAGMYVCMYVTTTKE